jgi:hypothetical protein
MGFDLFIFLVISAVPFVVLERNRKSSFWVFPWSLFAVSLPLFVFTVSCFLVPESKSACRLGWVDCFMGAKLALTPVVLFAMAALFAVEMFKVEPRKQPWVIVGVLWGAAVATVCSIIGWICFYDGTWPIRGWLMVPTYVAVWYCLRARQLLIQTRYSNLIYIIALLGSLPFWAASWFWSRYIFQSLPQDSGGCFVVTAASHGHARCVGPFVEITRNGRSLRANQQLMNFWQFESLWVQRAPRSHRAFRRCYNRFGPLLAAKIKSPWLADAVYLLLKPLESLAKYWVSRKAVR